MREDTRVSPRGRCLYPVSLHVEEVKPAHLAGTEGFGWKWSSPGSDFCLGSFGQFQYPATTISGIKVIFQILPKEHAGSLIASEVTSRRCLYSLNEGREKPFQVFQERLVVDKTSMLYTFWWQIAKTKTLRKKEFKK